MSDDEDMAKLYVEHAIGQAQKAGDLAVTDPDCSEAVVNTAQWAGIALERFIANGTPAIYASSLVLGVVHTSLLAKLLDPSDHA